MGDELLIYRLQGMCPDEGLKPWIPEAAEFIFKLEPAYRNQQLGPLYEMVRSAALELKDRPQKKLDDRSIFFSADAIIDADESLKEIKPQIVEIRKALFKKADPPFFSLSKALAWIMREEKIGRKKWADSIRKSGGEKKRRDRRRRLDSEISTKISELKKITGHDVEGPKYISHDLPGPGEEGWGAFIPVFPGSPLERLEVETRGLAGRTNFDQYSLVMNVLTDIKPLSYRYRTTETTGKETAFKVEIFRSLDFKEFTDLYAEMRAFFRVGGKKLNEKHLRIYKFVEGKGGVPKRGVRKFWRERQDEWNKLYPNDKFKGKEAGGLRMAYKRILKKREAVDDHK